MNECEVRETILTKQRKKKKEKLERVRESERNIFFFLFLTALITKTSLPLVFLKRELLLLDRILGSHYHNCGVNW